MLTQIHSDLWTQACPYHLAGLPIGRQLIALRLSSGGLWIHSPIPVTSELTAALARIGPVEHVVGPNCYHDECLSRFQRAYPNAIFHAAPDLAALKPTVNFSMELSSTPAPAWTDRLQQHMIAGMPKLNEFAFFHPASRTLMLTDIAFNLGYDQPVWATLVFRLAGIPVRMLGPSRFCRHMMSDKRAVRDSLDTILSWDFDRILVGHGRNIETGGKAALRSAFSFLYA